MDYMSLVGFFMATIFALVTGQSLPSGFPSRPIPLNRPPPPGLNPNRVLPNPFVVRPTNQLRQTYCPLDFQQPYTDPNILVANPVDLAQARSRAAGRLNDNQRLYLDAKRAQAVARDARQARDAGRSPGAPPRGAPTRGRSKRQTPDVALLAPTEKTSVCPSIEKSVQAVMGEDGNVYYLFEDEEIKYWECGSSNANMRNNDVQFTRYFCEADNYVFQTALAFSPNRNDVDWVTVNVPISCCSKKYTCDFTPYSSPSCPRTFTG